MPPAAYSRRFGSRTAAEIVRAGVLELSYTAHDVAPFARDLGHLDANGAVLPPFAWDEERRLHLRAKLDALYLVLYGIADAARPAESRDDVRHIFSIFPIVAREQQARWRRHRHLDLTLACINALWAEQPNAKIEG